MPRSLAERLSFELRQVRNELLHELSQIDESDLDYAPAPSMKTYRDLIHEIAWIAAESTIVITESRIPTEQEAMDKINKSSLSALKEGLHIWHEKLLGHLSTATDESLKKTHRFESGWAKFFGTTDVELEELIRWIARHEYYHLGQIITYGWIQGRNPYRDNAGSES
jgi:uncharacterized damage-inducible protein DinB